MTSTTQQIDGAERKEIQAQIKSLRTRARSAMGISGRQQEASRLWYAADDLERGLKGLPPLDRPWANPPAFKPADNEVSKALLIAMRDYLDSLADSDLKRDPMLRRRANLLVTIAKTFIPPETFDELLRGKDA